MRVEKTAEVAARVRLNSLSRDLKKTPKELPVPMITAFVMKKVITNTQP